MRYQSPPSDHTEQAQQSVQERAEQQRIARGEELKVAQADNKRWAANRERVLAERNNENTDVALTPLKEKRKRVVSVHCCVQNRVFPNYRPRQLLIAGSIQKQKVAKTMLFQVLKKNMVC
ncbi:hypothetical protein [Vibrio harveyi]|uniref:hypothetical protein n=1 Tax=Vibrio harveyi TaxID=669 RepID=UPI002ADFBA86|nr:hypothetical protein [Vibrio harveyi]